MRTWSFMLAGLAIWTAHFFALYAIASLWPGQPRAVPAIAIVSIAAIAANVAALVYARRHMRSADPLTRWIGAVAAAGAAIALLAVIWQSVPVLLV